MHKINIFRIKDDDEDDHPKFNRGQTRPVAALEVLGVNHNHGSLLRIHT